jgi:serine/threonine protein kinase
MNVFKLFACKRTEKLTVVKKITNNIELVKMDNSMFIVKYKRNKYNFRQELYILDKLSGLSAVSKVVAVDDEKVTMEYFKGGDLLEYYIGLKKLMSIEDSCRIVLNICYIVEDMHLKGVYHLDLKLENICINGGLNMLHIIDFSESMFLNDESMDNLVTTASYMSPEYLMLCDKDHIPKKDLIYVDTWCIGVILYTLLYGYCPFGSSSGTNINGIKNKIRKLDYKFGNREVPHELKTIIRSILVHRGELRPSLLQIREVVAKFVK